MSTESLFHHFVIDTPEGVERLVEAIELSMQDPPYVSPGNIRRLTDPEEIKDACDKILAAARLNNKAKAAV